MEMYISNELDVADQQAKYDTCAKRLLADKIILAFLLRETAAEFFGMSIEEIASRIEGDMEISTIPVYPGKQPAAIVGMPTEDKVQNEGEVYYDIRFYAVAPSGDKVLFDIEMQNKFRPGYDITVRGMFYCARMLSSQLETEFTIPNYQDIKKVYSIWICNNCPQNAGNAIVAYSPEPTYLAGNRELNMAYDLATVVLVCIGNEKFADKRTPLQRLLATLFSSTMTAEEKKNTLKKEFGITTNNARKEMLNHMCNFSEGILEKGIEKGIRQGYLMAVKSFISNGGTVDDACKMMPEITPEEREELQEFANCLKH